MARENNYANAWKSIRERKEAMSNRETQIIKEEMDKKKRFLSNYYAIRESGETKRLRYSHLLEMCRNDALKTAIKGIFIGALEANTLTDTGLILAETMVERWINEKGGAQKILGECKNKTYLLNRISEIVEEAAIIEADEIDKMEKDDSSKDDTNEDGKVEEPTDKEVDKAMETIKDKLGDDEEAKKALEVIKNKVGIEDDSAEDDTSDKKDDKSDEPDIDDEIMNSEDDKEDSKEKDDKESNKKDESKEKVEPKDTDTSDKKDDKSDDNSKDEEEDDDTSDENSEDLDIDDEIMNSEDDKEDSKEKDDESEKDSEEDVEIPDDATTTADDNETDIADDIEDDLEEVPEEPLSVDGEPESKGKVLDDLEKEDDVQKAVELIRQRVADAEENFIKRNAEDKKQVEELIGRISDNVKTVEDIADKDAPESKVAEESARMNKRRINDITTNRPLTILEKMTRQLNASILKDQVIKEQYLKEDNTIDTGLIVESAKVMYGFLETLNTLQLEKVDANYIQNILANM